LREANLGVPLDESLHAMARRVQSEDFDIVVSAYQVQREAGGNLAMVMDKVAETVRQRLRLRGELRVLTAQGRMSGWVLALLPVVVSLVLMLSSPDYFAPLLKDMGGRMVLFGALLWQLIGVLWMRKLVNVKV
jgi:tight adherence protein B